MTLTCMTVLSCVAPIKCPAKCATFTTTRTSKNAANFSNSENSRQTASSYRRDWRLLLGAATGLPASAVIRLPRPPCCITAAAEAQRSDDASILYITGDDSRIVGILRGRLTFYSTRCLQMPWREVVLCMLSTCQATTGSACAEGPRGAPYELLLLTIIL